VRDVTASSSGHQGSDIITYTVDRPEAELAPATMSTLYFVGVTTAHSSIRSVFPAWASALGLGDVRLVGIDMPLHADPALYRKVVEFIRTDPLGKGALVTTHKLDLFAAAHDLFDVIDTNAEFMEEVSCLSKLDGALVCHAKDPIASGLALESFIPPGYWEKTGADLVCMGAGGSAIAISWYVTQKSKHGRNHPHAVMVTNRSPGRLESLRKKFSTLSIEVPIEFFLTPTPEHNANVVAAARPGSLIVNATGLGKDAPGSPLPDGAFWPDRGYAWDLNYRGDLRFLDQARASEQAYHLHIEDGWVYFLHGWTRVIAEAFKVAIPTSGPRFDELSSIASRMRR
jgi:shikimate 5-dehydrogenase